MQKQILIIMIIMISLTNLIFAQMTVKDSDDNVLMEVNDEGTMGSIFLPDTNAALSSEDNKLYNLNGTLMWNGTALGSAGSAGGWTDGGANVYLSTNSDKVGIGTTSPGTKLSIDSNESTGDVLTIATDADVTGEYTGLLLEITNGLDYGAIRSYVDASNLSHTSILTGDNAGNSLTEKLTVTSQGNVGIGTTSPNYPLEVSSTGSIQLNLEKTDATQNQMGILFRGYDGTSVTNLWSILRRDGTNDLSFYAYGGISEHRHSMVIESNTRNVGIGTTSPGNTLEVIRTGATDSRVAIGATGTGKAELYLDASDGDFVGGDYFYIQNHDDGNTHMSLGGGDLGIISGNVGIGTTSPAQNLDVAGTAKMTGFIMPTGASGGYVLTSDASGMGTWQAATGGADSDWTISGDDMYSAVSGNVGIGTTSPGYKLDVNGTSRFVSTVTLPGGTWNFNGNVGIGTSPDPSMKLNIGGSMKADAYYDRQDTDYYVDPASSISARFNGSVGIGIGSPFPSQLLHVGGNAAISANLVVGSTTPGARLRVVGLVGTSSFNYVRYNPASGDFYYDTSSKRYKNKIVALVDDYEKILNLQPKKYTDRVSGEREIGYIAEELDEAGIENLVIYDDESQPNGLKYDRISLYLVEIIKDQQRRIEALEEKVGI